MRSMWWNRAGRPRSLISATVDTLIPPRAATFAARARPGCPVSWAAAPSTEEAPARPPKNR